MPAIWLDASNTNTVFLDTGATVQTASNGAVFTLADSLPNSTRKVVAGDTNSQPNLAVAAFNNRNMLNFNSTSVMRSPTGQAWMNAMRAGAAFTFRLVFTTTTGNGQGVVQAISSTSTGIGPGVLINTDEQTTFFAMYPVDDTRTFARTPAYTLNAIIHIVGTYDGSTMRLRSVAGGADATTPLSAVGSTVDQLVLGYLAFYDWHLVGRIGEFAMWPGAATSAEIDTLLSDAATWWGS